MPNYQETSYSLNILYESDIKRVKVSGLTFLNWLTGREHVDRLLVGSKSGISTKPPEC